MRTMNSYRFLRINRLKLAGSSLFTSQHLPNLSLNYLQFLVIDCGSASILAHDMVFLSWGRPSSEQQQEVINKTGTFNYDTKYKGVSSRSIAKLKEDSELDKDGFLINHSRVLVGSGKDSYEKGKTALQNWKHFGMDWAFVDPKTPVETNKKFCICVKEVLPWVMLPLQVVYVDESRKSRKGPAHFSYGSGTLQGHLLAGEERFSIELDGDGKVWYEITSFSKPAHFLSFLGYPYVKLRQKHFAHHSSDAVLKHLNASS